MWLDGRWRGRSRSWKHSAVTIGLTSVLTIGCSLPMSRSDSTTTNPNATFPSSTDVALEPSRSAREVGLSELRRYGVAESSDDLWWGGPTLMGDRCVEWTFIDERVSDSPWTNVIEFADGTSMAPVGDEDLATVAQRCFVETERTPTLEQAQLLFYFGDIDAPMTCGVDRDDITVNPVVGGFEMHYVSAVGDGTVVEKRWTFTKSGSSTDTTIYRSSGDASSTVVELAARRIDAKPGIQPIPPCPLPDWWIEQHG